MYNYKAKYKALCKDELVIVNDYFIADFESNETIKYQNIQNIDKNEKKVYIQHHNLASILEFEKVQDAQTFFKALQNKVSR